MYVLSFIINKNIFCDNISNKRAQNCIFHRNISVWLIIRYDFRSEISSMGWNLGVWAVAFNSWFNANRRITLQTLPFPSEGTKPTPSISSHNIRTSKKLTPLRFLSKGEKNPTFFHRLTPACVSRREYFFSKAGVGSAKKVRRGWGRSVPIEPWMRLFPSSMLSTENVCGRHFELWRDACVPYVGCCIIGKFGWILNPMIVEFLWVGSVKVDGGSAIYAFVWLFSDVD